MDEAGKEVPSERLTVHKTSLLLDTASQSSHLELHQLLQWLTGLYRLPCRHSNDGR